MIPFVILAAAAVTVSPASTMSRNASLINALDVFCFLEPPNFERIDRKYSAMKLPVLQDLQPPSNGLASTRSKSWLGALATGPFQLVAARGDGPKGHVEMCGISALDPQGEAFRDELMTKEKLGAPDTEEVEAIGTRKSVWNLKGVGQLILSDGSTLGKTGFLLDFVVQTTTKPDR